MITLCNLSIIDKALYFSGFHNIRPDFLYMEIAMIFSAAEHIGVDRLAIHESGTNDIVSDFQKGGESVLIKHELSIQYGQGSFIQKIIRATEEKTIIEFNPIAIESSLEDRVVSQVMIYRASIRKRIEGNIFYC